MASSIPCGPCSHDSIHKNAEKWCTDCNEGFCNVCEKSHKSMKMSRDHNFILIEEYREIENINVVFECQEHESKFEMYCKKHEIAICIKCFPAMHKDCSDAIIPLAEAANNAKSSTAFVELEHAINDTLETIEICVKDRESAAERLEKQEMAIKKIISNTQKNIKRHLDDLERKLLNELSTTYSSCQSKYGKLKNQLNDIEKEIKRLNGQTTQLKRVAPDLQEAKIDQAQIHKRKSVHDTTLELKKKFTIKQKGNEMYISGCTIMASGNLLIADHKGQTVLMEYNEDGHFIRDIPVSAHPWDLAVIDTDRIAVSYRSLCYIEIIDIKKIIVLKTVELKDKCNGISYSDGKIYVVVRNKGIVVLDIKGTILSTIKCRSNVFNISTSNTRIYYTQRDQGIVCSCIKTGEELWDFKDLSLVTPGGIAVDSDQNVFAAGIESNNLLMLQDDGKVKKSLLSETDGLQEPIRLCYNMKNNLLLMCNKRNQSAFLYSVI
ncbi:Hypothetical predicted protein [Mytilus galloprovincialis]|uniref:B box-type domain-containing protein n=1 Tax=Mytilus galloprovincialis TaxID=29158 RepID=A0A8B6F202_MYTGA|nr:Hypothetical predicted protein [Mytilus galloprovincialis]